MRLRGDLLREDVRKRPIILSIVIFSSSLFDIIITLEYNIIEMSVLNHIHVSTSKPSNISAPGGRP